ncbi:MAG: hypothetical protein BWK76_13330 [Desulfobulbaceae bacterium A2]|nr:MAG: hypothetical protein BWK76_13330 [Desulfobulbaceae bacterium A2]
MKTLLALCLVLALAAPAAASQLVDVSIVSRDSRQTLAAHHHKGKTYVAGQPGEYYAVRVANKSGKRLLIVISVDGVNAITGQTAATEQSGYVLESGARTEITGWRKSTEEVAGFYFTRLPDSYAARTDRPANVGVIGVATFREYEEPRPVAIAPQPSSRDEAAQAVERNRAAAGADERPAPSAGAAPSSAMSPVPPPLQKQAEKLGTGHGTRESSPITYTTFRRAGNRPDEETAIFYDSYDNLVASGVITRRPPPPPPDPRPFPQDFVPDPRR